MANVQKYSTVEELRYADERLDHSPALLGMSMLTYPSYVNAMRSNMFTSHLNQFLNLENPEIPLVFTNSENLVGKYSSGYKKAKSDFVVCKKVSKFKNSLGKNARIYQLFIYNEKDNMYDVISRKDLENLTENFAYSYDNKFIDYLKKGDTIKAGEVFVKSKSYDDFMNYRYGLNATVMLTLDSYTSEDAAVVSRSLAERATSIESEPITVNLNNNDYLLNLYGDKKNYKPLPYIGEKVSGILMAYRRQYNNQLLYDFRDDILNEILDTDTIVYCQKDSEIIDYTIYCNAEELEDNPFYHEITLIMKEQYSYWSDIYKTCQKIIDSGADYTLNVDYLYKRSKEFLDETKKWKDGDRIFGNIEIEVTYKRLSSLAKASKFSGRFGNKSVVADIREEEDMPYTKDGRRVNAILSILSVINRTTAMVLFEIFINNCSWKIVKRIQDLKTLQEKEKLFFRYLSCFSEDEYNHIFKKYKDKTKEQKRKFFSEELVIKGININVLPLWEDRPLFYKCIDCLKKFDFLEEDTLYIKQWGRERKILNKTLIGGMYIIKLKQSDRRGFSVRSTGAVSMKGLPTRSFKSKAHLEQYSSSCIRFRKLNPYIVIYR